MNVNHACRLFQDAVRVRTVRSMLNRLHWLLEMGGAKEAAAAVDATMRMVDRAHEVGLKAVVDRETSAARRRGRT